MKKLILSLGAKLAVLYELLKLKLLKGLGLHLASESCWAGHKPNWLLRSSQKILFLYCSVDPIMTMERKGKPLLFSI
jgi:hypothetical protein